MTYATWTDLQCELSHGLRSVLCNYLNTSSYSEEVRQGHVISKIADAGTRESMAFCIHFLEASSALERQANHFFSLPICSCLVKLLFRLRSPVKAHF